MTKFLLVLTCISLLTLLWWERNKVLALRLEVENQQLAAEIQMLEWHTELAMLLTEGK